MSFKPFQYYLIEIDGRSLHVVNGVITSSGSRKPLPNTPKGWEDILIAWERNRLYHGLTRNYSNELGFVRDGAMIIKDSFYNSSIERKIFLLVQRFGVILTDDYYKFMLNYLYKGELDFSTVKDKGPIVSVSIMEGGLSKLLKAAESKVFEIPFDADAVFVENSGIDMTIKQNWIITQAAQTSILDNGIHLVGIIKTTQDGSAVGLAAFDVYFDKSEPSDLTNDTRYFFLTTKAINGINVKGSVIVADPLSNGHNYTLQIKSDLGQVINVVASTPLANGQNIFNFDLNINSTGTEKFFLIGSYGSSPESLIAYGETEVAVTLTTRKETTYHWGYFRKDLVKKLAALTFGSEEYAAISELLANDNRVITCGNAVRGLPDPTIKTSWLDFFMDLDTDLMAGLDIEQGPATANLPAGQRIVIEGRAHFYDPSNPVDLGECKNLEVSHAKDMGFTKIKTGWQKQNINDVNGKSDFNGTNEFSAPVTRDTGELSLVSPYKAGPLEIENERINMEGRTTTDSSKDHENFVMVVDKDAPQVFEEEVTFVAAQSWMIFPDTMKLLAGQKIRITGSASNNITAAIISVSDITFISSNVAVLDGVLVDEGPVTVTIEILEGKVYPLLREVYDNQGDPEDFGVPSPTTIYNIDLSPKRKLLRHGAWIRSILNNLDTEKIIFLSGKDNMNTKLNTVQGSVIIAEDTDIDVSTLGAKMLQPYYLDFETKVPVDLVDILEASTNRCFQLTDEDGTVYKGFQIKSGLAINTRLEQQFKLLSTADNDLSKRI